MTRTMRRTFPATRGALRVLWRRPDPFKVPRFLRPRFLRRRARLIDSPFWECARCHGDQGKRATQSPRFCEFGCDDAELERMGRVALFRKDETQEGARHG